MLSAADKGGDKSQEEQIKQDEALARKLGEQEDAAMARQLADEDRAGNPRQPSRPAAWAPFPAEPAYGQPHSSGTPWNENISCEDDGLFGCGLDWCTGCVVIWCGWLTAAQLYERVKGPRGVFYWIIFGFLMLWILEFFFGTIHYHQARVDQEIEERVYYPDGSYTKHYNFKLKPDVWSSLASFTHFVFLFVCVVLVMLVRTALRRRDGLEARQCCGFEDACYSSFCFPCTSCLLLRRTGLRDYSYWILSPDGGLESLTEGRPILDDERGRGPHRV